MAQFVNIYPVDLQKGPIEVSLNRMYMEDIKANRVGVTVTDCGAAVTLGGTCSGTAILSNGSTVAISGTTSGNQAYIELPSAVYTVDGPVEVFVNLTNGGITATLLHGHGTVVQTDTGSVIDPGTIIPSVSALIDAIDDSVASIPADYTALLAAVAPTFSAFNNYTAGRYVWYSGNLYRFTADHAAGSWTGTDAVQVVVTNEIANLKSAMQDNEIIDVFEDGTYSNSTWRGITLTWNNKVATLSGTATGGNFTSPNIFANANGFPANISAGDIINVNIASTTANVYLNIFSYVNNSLTNEATISHTQKYTIPENATGLLIRLIVYNGATVNGDISFTITKSATVKSQETVLPTILPAKDSIVDTIEAVLNKYGIAVLGKGTYELDRAINMPDGSMIKGAGEATVIQAATGADAIVAGASCTIENVKIHSDTGHTQSPGTAAGIRVSGNYDATPLKYNIKISNITIDGFPLAGIYGTKTGTWVGDSISAINCTIFHCYAGIFLEDYSEFGRYTNIMCRDNYIGLLNKSGNNVFENCSFSNNTVGVYLMGDDGDNSRNNGHGSVIGCTINHSNNNNGFAVICRGLDANGFVFNSCQIWYGKIQVEQSTGIIFENCMIGAYDTETVILNYSSNDLFLMNCLFKVGASFDGSSGGETHIINCFKFDGTPVTLIGGE